MNNMIGSMNNEGDNTMDNKTETVIGISILILLVLFFSPEEIRAGFWKFSIITTAVVVIPYVLLAVVLFLGAIFNKGDTK